MDWSLVTLVILRWMHILGAIGLVGGVLFYWRAILPETARLSESDRDQRWQAILPNWARLVMICILLLLASGIVNIVLMARRGDFKSLPSAYHGLLGIKVLLAVLVFGLMSLITGRSAAARRIRRGARMWIAVTVLLGIAVVCIAGIMKVMHG